MTTKISEATITPTPAAAPSQTATPVAPDSPLNPASPAVVATPAVPTMQPGLEKFKVVKADGSIDHEGTTLKLLKSYVHLERRFRSGDIPPETEEGYKLDYSAFPADFKINPEVEKALLKTMHASGMTNKQVQTVMNNYSAGIKQGLEIQKKQEADKISETLRGVESDLKTSWGGTHEENVSAAVRGFHHLADNADKADIAKIGVDARATYRILMKVLAKVGLGITEDSQLVNADSVGGDGTIEDLKNSEAYKDSSHPDHEKTMAKVTSWYQRRYPKK